MRWVGRSAEIAVLDEVLDGARRAAAAPGEPGTGTPVVVDITGEAGIGKSRLLAEACARARRQGMTVLRGRATEYERHLPFQMFTDALADLPPRAWEGFPDAGTVAPLLRGGAAADRFVLHRATVALLRHLGSAGGLLVALDDIHWADHSSMELLDHLVRHPAHPSVVVFGTRRERQSPSSLTATLARGGDTGAVLGMPVGPLDERACVEEITPDLPRGEAEALYTASGGNPLYFLTLLQAHRAGAPVAGPLSRGVGALLLDELVPLSPGQRTLVEAVAALGDHATPAMLACATGRTAVDVTADLEVLTSRDLLRTAALGRLALRHPVFRAVVHEDTPPWRRVEFHARAAAELARRGAPAAEQAHHVERSMTGWDPAAVEVLIEAAAQAAAVAPASCAHWLAVVLRHLPHTREHEARRCELTLLRARALGACGGLRESRELLQDVIATAHPSSRLGSGAGAGSGVRVSAVVLCALMERHLGRSQEALALLRRELGRGPEPADALLLGMELGSAAPHAADSSYAEVRGEVKDALATARSLGDEVREAGVLAVCALGEAYEGAMAAASGFARQAAALVDALPDENLTELCEPLARLGWAEAFLEEYGEAERHTDRGLAVARRSGQVYLVPHLLLCKSHVRVQTCRFPSALELAEEAEDIARGIGSDQLLSFVLAGKAAALVPLCAPGDPRPLAVAEEAVAAAGTRVNWWASTAWVMLGYAALVAGDPVRAREAVLRAGGPDLVRLQPSLRPLYMEILVTAALATGDPDAARHWAERAHKEAQQLGLASQRSSALRSSAHLPLQRGDTAAAADLFARAAEESARSGADFWEAQSLLLEASVRTTTGGEERGRAAWLRGRDLAAAGGSGLLLGLADAIRPAAPPADTGSPSRRTAAGPADALATLTAREREIAELVALGLTSRAIADRLVLSHRTVETHVSRALRKTGVPSRAALASLVVRSAGRRAAGRGLTDSGFTEPGFTDPGFTGSDRA
ncbi:helix-turn-helix transcriptional regulator [Streptomyces phyllanthi]|uniref:AAA family ATPase n=1 Tax=Streptomyces phyllanthi TaxID=1803180 RepID=A0A5N8WFV0_9ACTN|nr:AAA family ATPase [Streptomyces phyllanthi]MPY45314.1 AAA family ATPase [Streptomyces phyllanthi]